MTVTVTGSADCCRTHCAGRVEGVVRGDAAGRGRAGRRRLRPRRLADDLLTTLPGVPGRTCAATPSSSPACAAAARTGTRPTPSRRSTGATSEAARALARQLARSPADADDLVAGAFTRMLEILRAGRGPTEAFRAYLLTSVRHLAYDRSRAERRLDLTDDIADVHGIDPDGTIVPFTDPALAGLERTLAARAFATLPERWQAVLWHLEVEGDSPADIAPLFGLTANAVSALGYRAREGLRQAYLQEHLASGSGRWDRRHRETGEKLGAYTRGGLARREAQRVEAHLRRVRRVPRARRRAARRQRRHDPLRRGAARARRRARRLPGVPRLHRPAGLRREHGRARHRRGRRAGRARGADRDHRRAPPGRADTGSVSPAPSASRAWWASPRSSSATSSSHPPRRRRPRRGSPCRPRPRRGSPCRPWRCCRRGCPGCRPRRRCPRCSRRRSPAIPRWPCPTSPAPASGRREVPGAPETGPRRRCPREGCRTGTGRTAARSSSDPTPRSADRTPARSAARSAPSSAGGPVGESAARPATAALVVLAPERTRRAAADCAVTTRLPALGSAGLVCPTGRAEREASLDSRR